MRLAFSKEDFLSSFLVDLNYEGQGVHVTSSSNECFASTTSLEHALGYHVIASSEHRHHLGIRDASWVRAVDSVDKLQTVQVWLTVQINQT